MTDELVVVAKFVAKEGKAEQLHRVLYSLLAPTRKESGCLSYELHQSLDNPLVFTMLEKFKNKAAGELHVKQPYLVAFINKLPELVESSVVDVYKIAEAP